MCPLHVSCLGYRVDLDTHGYIYSRNSAVIPAVSPPDGTSSPPRPPRKATKEIDCPTRYSLDGHLLLEGVHSILSLVAKDQLIRRLYSRSVVPAVKAHVKPAVQNPSVKDVDTNPIPYLA